MRAPIDGLTPISNLSYCANDFTGRQQIPFQRIRCRPFDDLILQESFPNEFNILTRVNRSFFSWNEDEVMQELNLQSQFLAAFVQDVESYTMKIDHQFQVTPLEERDVDSDGTNGEFDGRLEDRNGEVLQEFTDQYDIVTLNQLLTAAGVSLDDIDSRSGETLRYSGMQLIFFIKYVQSRSGKIEYEYRLKQVNHAEHKKLLMRYYNSTHGILENRHSISIKFVADGLLGVFDFYHLMLCLVSSLSLLVLATTITEYMMLYCLPLAEEFTEMKYDSSGPDFSTLRAEKGLDCCGVRTEKSCSDKLCGCCRIKSRFYVSDKETIKEKATETSTGDSTGPEGNYSEIEI